VGMDGQPGKAGRIGASRRVWGRPEMSQTLGWGRTRGFNLGIGLGSELGGRACRTALEAATAGECTRPDVSSSPQGPYPPRGRIAGARGRLRQTPARRDRIALMCSSVSVQVLRRVLTAAVTAAGRASWSCGQPSRLIVLGIDAPGPGRDSPSPRSKPSLGVLASRPGQLAWFS
jgi:hypothetical protein